MIEDIRFVVRTLARDRRFTRVVMLTLALGIAINTTAFTLLSSLALRPLSAPDADRLVRLYPVDVRGQRHNLFSYRDYLDYRETSAVKALAAYVPVTVTLQTAAAVQPPADDALAYAISSDYFTILGMRPAAGRIFTAEDDQTGAARVAVISHTLWSARFQRDPAAVGSAIEVNGRSFTIVGVADGRFIGTEPLAPQLWVPLAAHDVVAPGADVFDNRDKGWLLLIARLQDGMSRATAEAGFSVMARQLAATYPSALRPAAVVVTPATFFSIEPRVWPVIATVMAVAFLVLLVAGANVANLTLARAASRQRELAIRLALGATRQRIVRLLVVESLALGSAAGGAGLLLSGWALRVLYPLGAALVPFPAAAVILDLTPDVRVFTYTFALAAATGLAIALAPALQFSSTAVAPALHDDGAVAGTRMRPSRVRQALVVVQVACCVVLLAGAGLLTRAVQRARTLHLGFEPRSVLMTSADLERHGYNEARAAEFNRRLAARAAQLPGARAAAFTTHVPLTGGIRLSPVAPDTAPAIAITAPVRFVTPGYFDVLRIPIVTGRTFTEDELARRGTVAVISETLAKRFWPAGDALGKTVRTSTPEPAATIIGVVRDTSASTLWQGKEMAVYFPADETVDPRDLHLIVAVDGDVLDAAALLRTAARQVTSDVPVRVERLEEAVRLWILPSRVAAAGTGMLAVVTLLLAAVGLYGVLSYNVAQRTREIGIRLALGAASGDVLRLVVRDGVRLIALGLAAGLIAALLATRVLRGLLLDVSALDPLTFAAVSVVLCAVGLAACYVPARRASCVEPLHALRS